MKTPQLFAIGKVTWPGKQNQTKQNCLWTWKCLYYIWKMMLWYKPEMPNRWVTAIWDCICVSSSCFNHREFTRAKYSQLSALQHQQGRQKVGRTFLSQWWNSQQAFPTGTVTDSILRSSESFQLHVISVAECILECCCNSSQHRKNIESSASYFQ